MDKTLRLSVASRFNMAHAKAENLTDLKDLLSGIRLIHTLKEKSLGCFYLKGKGVLHFHIKADRRFAHVFDGDSWHEVDIKAKPSKTLQKQILKELCTILPLS